MALIAVICGLKSEAAVVRKSVGEENIRIGISGADAGRAYELAYAACQDGAAAVISIGVSGGLDPVLAPGDLVIGSAIIAEDGGQYEADQYLLNSLLSAHSRASGNPALQDMEPAALDPGFRREKRSKEGARIKLGTLFGSDAIISSPAHKAALFANHAAIAVDMESHGAARAASEANVPFIAIRAIADPADRALPKAALGAVAPDGSTRVLKTLFDAMKAPAQFPALMQLGSDSNKALATLSGALPEIFDRLFGALDR
ncbi:MAG: hypothetical protein AAGD92_13855 [Pseudomonadota bacterium]